MPETLTAPLTTSTGRAIRKDEMVRRVWLSVPPSGSAPGPKVTAYEVYRANDLLFRAKFNRMETTMTKSKITAVALTALTLAGSLAATSGHKIAVSLAL